MKHFTRILTGLMLGMTVFALSIQGADEAGNPNKFATRKPEELISRETQTAWLRRIAAIDFGEGNPLQWVAGHLSERFPEINFVVPENARDAVVPPLVLRNVTLSEILKAVELASQGRIRVSPPQSAAPKVGPDGLPIPGAMAGQNIVAFMVARPSRETAVPSCRVFNLVPYLEGRTAKESEPMIQELYDALNLAWEMMKKGGAPMEKPALSIHSGTQLLIAVGRDQELSVIEQVVKQLQGSTGGVGGFASVPKHRFSVLGEVNEPGWYEVPADRSINLLQAISMAGGLTRAGNLKTVTIQRSGARGRASTRMDVDVEAMTKDKNRARFEIMDGDIITIEEKRHDNE